VKPLRFAICLIALAAAAVPAAAQMSGGYDGYSFVEAVRKSDSDKALQLLNSHPTGLINAKAADGQTALIVALARSDDTWAAFLINKGADPNLAGKGGDTPLITAARVGFSDAVDWLLAAGARVDTANRMGETPLIVAVQQRQPAVAQLLLNRGANPDKADSAAGYSARDYAARDPRARDILRMIEAKKPKAAPAK
jgi:ankyrin repeat protein